MSSQDPYGAPYPYDRGAGDAGGTTGNDQYYGRSEYGFTPYEGYKPSATVSPYGPPATGPARRPGTVLAACLMTWIGNGLLSAGLVLAVIVGLAGGFDETSEGGDDDTTAVMVFSIIVLVICVALILLAVAAFRGRLWAAVTLTVVGGLVAGLMLLSALASPSSAAAGLPIALYVAAAVGLLWGPAAMRFYRSRSTARGTPGVGPGGYSSGSTYGMPGY